NETRMPFWRSRPANSRILVSTAAPRRLVEDVLACVGRGRHGELRLLPRHVILQLLLGLANVTFVLEDRAERIIDERVVEGVDVEERQGPRPIERLADARSLLQIELPNRPYGADQLVLG